MRTDSKKQAKILGDIIRESRIAQKITQADLAVKANVNESYLSAVENGYSFVSLNKLLNICEGLEMDPNELIDELLIREAGDTENSESDEDEEDMDDTWFFNG